jgi:hypothetical protein
MNVYDSMSFINPQSAIRNPQSRLGMVVAFILILER